MLVKNSNKKVLLIGPPNVGKSTFFNRITKSVSQVANYSGTTNKPYLSSLKNYNIDILDLPGASSIISNLPSEKITNSYYLKNNFNRAIVFVSALNLKNNLLNMIDYFEVGNVGGIIVTQIDEQKKFFLLKNRFEKILGINTLPLISLKAKVTSELIDLFSSKFKDKFRILYDDEVEDAIKILEKTIKYNSTFSKRFISIQALLNRFDFLKQLLPLNIYNEILQTTKEITSKKINYVSMIMEKRKKFIDNIVTSSCLLTSEEVVKNFKKSKIDSLLLNKFFGVTIFIIIMSLVYFLSFSQWTGSFLQAKIVELLMGSESFPGLLGVLQRSLISQESHWFGISLLLNGILQPIFLVISFFPYLFIFFILTTIMKQSGYYARAVAVFDSILERFGLSGHSIISIIAGLGCNLPALISTRSIKSKKERHITAFIIPLIPCSARLTVNTILIALFFNGNYSWFIIIVITVLSGVIWLIISLVLSKTLFRKKHQWIVLSIPKWRKIDTFYIFKSSLKMVKQYLIRMSGYLIISSLIIQLLSSLGPKGVNNYTLIGYNNSLLYYLSNIVSYIFKPLGFGSNWQTSTALISGIPAKEVILTTLISTSNVDGGIVNLFTPQSIISFVIFSSFYTPCTPGAILLHKETKSTKGLIWIHLLFSFVLAWLLAFVIYQLMILSV